MSDERELWLRERAQLRKQITDLERIKHDLEGRMFDALKTDKWLAAGLHEVDHAMDPSRAVFSRVLDVACVAVARVKELEAASNVCGDASGGETR